MRTPKILRKIVVGVFVLFWLVMLVAAETRYGRGLMGVSSALPANIVVVTNTNDSGPGSLRNALAVAHPGDTIDATGVSGTILLTSGALHIGGFFNNNNNLLIIGPGAGNLAVDGNATFPVFKNFARGVTISGFTITNGLADSNGGGGIQNPGGPGSGGVQQVELTVTSCSVVSNTGVGISNIANNENPYQPGVFSTLTITDSTVSGNSSGGISNIAEAGETGGAGAELTVSNCTISGNTASNGGGILNAGGSPEHNGHANAAISNSTFSDNSADTGGAIYNGGGTSGGAFVRLGSTILNAGASGGTIFINGGGVASLGYNLASDNGGGVLTGPADQINTNPMLGPLQDNGGPTFTHALLPGSRAIDAGDPSFTPPPFYDQRGPDFFRVRNARIDIGSFEVQLGSTPTPTPTGSPTPTAAPTATPTPTPTATPTSTPTPTATATPALRPTPTPRPQPTPAPRL